MEQLGYDSQMFCSDVAVANLPPDYCAHSYVAHAGQLLLCQPARKTSGFDLLWNGQGMSLLSIWIVPQLCAVGKGY